MLNEIIYAILQAATEFLPVSSSGHLALVSNIIDKPNLFFFTVLHLASLIAVLIFTRKEIFKLITFEKNYRKMWLFIIIATIPAALLGFLFQDFIEQTFSSYLFLASAFFFTGTILLLTRFFKAQNELNWKNSLFIGIAQVLALFPGVSRSGMTISSSLFSGIKKEEAVKFSFLLFIPLALGAFVLEFKNYYFDFSLLASFVLCALLSILFLNLLYYIVKTNKFWLFSIYCFLISLVSLLFYFFQS